MRPGDSSFERDPAACPVSSCQIWKVFSGPRSSKIEDKGISHHTPVDGRAFNVFSSTLAAETSAYVPCFLLLAVVAEKTSSAQAFHPERDREEGPPSLLE